MKYTIEGGSLPVVRIQLEKGDIMVSQAGGRAWSKGEIKTETSSEGGVGKAIGRKFAGESLFMSRYIAEEDAEIAFASSFPGKILDIELGSGQSIIAQRKAFLCGTQGIELSAYVQKKLGTALVGGEGAIMQRITGPGTVFLEIDGHCVEYELGTGERVVADTGVLAAMDETCTMSVERVKGLKKIFFGGEGFIDTVITGPGKVYLQSMTIEKLASLIIPFMPEKK